MTYIPEVSKIVLSISETLGAAKATANRPSRRRRQSIMRAKTLNAQYDLVLLNSKSCPKSKRLYPGSVQTRDPRL